MNYKFILAWITNFMREMAGEDLTIFEKKKKKVTEGPNFRLSEKKSLEQFIFWATQRAI